MLHTEQEYLSFDGNAERVADAELVLRTDLQWVLHRSNRHLSSVGDARRKLRIQ